MHPGRHPVVAAARRTAAYPSGDFAGVHRKLAATSSIVEAMPPSPCPRDL